MDVILAAILIVLVGVAVLAIVAAFATVLLGILWLFWPAIAGVALALVLAEAGADSLATGCLVGGLIFNVLWWFGAPVLADSAEVWASSRRHRHELEQQFIKRAKHEYGGRPEQFVHDRDDLASVALDPDARKLLIWTVKPPEIIQILDGQQVLSAEVEAIPPVDDADGQPIECVELRLTLLHPLMSVNICFARTPGGGKAAYARQRLEEAHEWARRINAIRS